MRSLDLFALRAFVTVADTGGITRAAGVLNLTQSAVSMQIKRLEEALQVNLLDRVGRGVALSAHGERLLGSARRMLELNDKIIASFATPGFDEEIKIGVPYDVLPSIMPHVLKQFRAAYPRSKLLLTSSVTVDLKEDFAKGDFDLIVTTERGCDPGGETLYQMHLSWVGAEGGTAFTLRPLRIAFGHSCVFRPFAMEALDRAGLDWEMAIEASSDRETDTVVAADIAISARLDGLDLEGVRPLKGDHGLPELGDIHINMYRSSRCNSPALDYLAAMLRQDQRPLQLAHAM